MTDLNKIQELVIENLAFYDAPANALKIKMYARELQDLPLADIDRAFGTFRREKGRRLMPMPADVRDRIRPETVSDDGLAIEATTRITQATSKFGRDRGSEAKGFIGELGWEIVQRLGGWRELCRQLGDEYPIGVFQTQSVKIGKAVIEQKRAGVLGQPPAIPTEALKNAPLSAPQLTNSPEVARNIIEPVKGKPEALQALGEIIKNVERHGK